MMGTSNLDSSPKSTPLTKETGMSSLPNDTNWAVTEFADGELGDLRRSQRLVALASVLSQHPTAALPEACGDSAMLKAAYRFFERLLRLIIRCGQQIVRVATMLGLLLRIMLVKRYNDYRGCVKAEWIASLFGVSRHRVNMERAKLINEGLFQRLPTPQWVKNKYGEWVVLNLKETEPTAPVENPADTAEKLEPPAPENLPKLGAPDLNQIPSSSGSHLPTNFTLEALEV